MDAGPERVVKIAFGAILVLVYAFLMAPIAFVVLSSFGDSALLAFPPTQFTLQWYSRIPAEFVASLETSLAAAGITVVLAILFGTGIALTISRGQGRLTQALGIVAMAPLSMPHLAIGIALYEIFLLQWDLTGLELAGSFAGLVAGHLVIALPYVVRGVSAGHAHFDRSIEEAALNLGASRWRTLRSVTFPMLLPGIVSGGFLAFLASFDDVPVALFMGGGPNSTTLPLRILSALEFSLQPDVMAMSSLIVFVSIVGMVALDRMFGLERFFGGRRAQ
jgi:putative spermidine/putrescine transport system permease protein